MESLFSKMIFCLMRSILTNKGFDLKGDHCMINIALDVAAMRMFLVADGCKKSNMELVGLLSHTVCSKGCLKMIR